LSAASLSIATGGAMRDSRFFDRAFQRGFDILASRAGKTLGKLIDLGGANSHDTVHRRKK